MKSALSTSVFKSVFILIFCLLSDAFYAQETELPKAKTGAFWEHVQIGGGLGVSVGSGFTNITVAPSAIYNFNEQFAFGAGVQYSYLKQKKLYTSNVVGGSLIGLYNPIQEIQLSLEAEETNVNNNYIDTAGDYKRNFWNTGLFVGAGLRQENFTIGGRINLLYDKNKDIYGSAFMPFVRVYF